MSNNLNTASSIDFINATQAICENLDIFAREMHRVTFNEFSYIPCHHKICHLNNIELIEDVCSNNNISGNIWINPVGSSFCFSLNKKTPLLKSQDFYSGIMSKFKENFLLILKQKLKVELFDKLPSFKSSVIRNSKSFIYANFQTDNIQEKTSDLGSIIFEYLHDQGLFSNKKDGLVDRDHPLFHSESQEGIQERYSMQSFINQQTDLDPQYFGVMFYYLTWDSLMEATNETLNETRVIINGMLSATLELSLYDCQNSSEEKINSLINRLDSLSF